MEVMPKFEGRFLCNRTLPAEIFLGEKMSTRQSMHFVERATAIAEGFFIIGFSKCEWLSLGRHSSDSIVCSEQGSIACTGEPDHHETFCNLASSATQLIQIVEKYLALNKAIERGKGHPKRCVEAISTFYQELAICDPLLLTHKHYWELNGLCMEYKLYDYAIVDTPDQQKGSQDSAR